MPKNLAELGSLVPKELLTDPFSGKELCYRVVKGDFLLYSTGYNGADDKGTQGHRFFEEGQSREDMPDIIIHAPGK